ncbi:hypothetical protein EJV46_20385 [Roseococcus sp. SYP-B2431]|uniref:hypothetical protein n=1 Tax=Roseococcus sp. SYP-B2431 TaxID=2496640 RepID=UPI00103E4E90|nr:hypothetical protein [Roseococcus sp. SYP-B2431]TCH96341.1 hypothetical protein EJV46_20385 [Roseococcus sp. SYP-B2431]
MDTVPSTEIAAGHKAMNEDIAALRAQVDALTGDRLHPVVVAGADYAQSAVDWVESGAERWVSKIRDRPLASIGIAALAGYVLAAMRRR